MEIYFNKDQLTGFLQLVVAITSKSTSDPIINNVLIEASQENGGTLMISATDYDLTLQGGIPAEIVQEGKICLNAHKMFHLVKEMLSEKIHLRSTDQNWVFLEGGTSKIKLPGVESGYFPPIGFEELESEITIKTSVFKAAIDRTLFAIGDNQSRKNLLGLNFKILDEETIQWVSADGFRISQVITKQENPIQYSGNLIIPKRALLEIKKILDSAEAEVEIRFNDSFFQLYTGEKKFKTKLIEAEYPDLSKVIFETGKYIAEISKAEITNAVRILAMFSEDKASSMRFTFEDNKLYIESEKLEFGEANHILDCHYEGERFQVGFNVRFFLDALNSFDSSKTETVKVHCMGTLAPCMLKCVEWDDYKTIIMPMSIKW